MRVNATWEPVDGADFYRVTVFLRLYNADGTWIPSTVFVYECPPAYRGGEPARNQIHVDFACLPVADTNVGYYYVSVVGFSDNRNLAVEVVSSQWSIQYGNSFTFSQGRDPIRVGVIQPKFIPEFIPMGKRCIRG